MEHRTDYLDNGFTILHSAISEVTLTKARQSAEQFISYAESNSSDILTNYYMPHRPEHGVLYDLYQRYPEFVVLARNEILVDTLASIYSENYYLYENSLVYKPKGKENAVPWHQDFINRPNEPLKAIAWMALDDITEENGCMWVIPGSHNQGFLPWMTVKGETHHTRLDLSKTNLDESKAVPVELKAGDILIFNQLLVHSSRKVSTDKLRRAYRVSYQSMDTSFTPRGTPIVISLKNKSVLEKEYIYSRPEDKNLLIRSLNKIGRKLASL